jgi:hypothetical protein
VYNLGAELKSEISQLEFSLILLSELRMLLLGYTERKTFS